MMLTVARVWPDFFLGGAAGIATDAAFNLTDWLLHGVCRDRMPSDAVCSDQGDTAPEDPCMFPWTVSPEEVNRYYYHTSLDEQGPQVSHHHSYI